MTTVSQARFAEWLAEVRAEHIQQERAQWLARLRRHAGIKFGAQTAERLAMLLGATVAAEQMEHVGDWIMECDHGGDLLARVATMRPNGDEI